MQIYCNCLLLERIKHSQFQLLFLNWPTVLSSEYLLAISRFSLSQCYQMPILLFIFFSTFANTTQILWSLVGIPTNLNLRFQDTCHLSSFVSILIMGFWFCFLVDYIFVGIHAFWHHCYLPRIPSITFSFDIYFVKIR